jgi:hypothetical protein
VYLLQKQGNKVAIGRNRKSNQGQGNPVKRQLTIKAWNCGVEQFTKVDFANFQRHCRG